MRPVTSKEPMIESAKGGSSLTTSAEAPSASSPIAAVADALPLQSPARRWWRRADVARGESDFLDDRVAANAWVPIALASLIVCAFLFRFAAADQLSSHVDES